MTVASGAERRPSGREGGVRFRSARPADLPRLVRIERASFPLPWSETAFRSVMRREDGRVIVAQRGGSVVGYAVVWFAADEGELGDLAVAPDHRRRGVGRALLEEALEEARVRGADHLFLQVRESNEAALRLYDSAGFRKVGRRRGYYRSPSEDALVLQRAVPPAAAPP